MLSHTGVLILNGENDTQTPVQQALLLQQRLTEVKHPDHTMVTYPNLRYGFYLSSQWFTENGPVPEYILQNMFGTILTRNILIVQKEVVLWIKFIVKRKNHCIFVYSYTSARGLANMPHGAKQCLLHFPLRLPS